MVCIFTLERTNLVVDVNAFVPVGGAPIPSEPARLLDTRSGPGLVTVARTHMSGTPTFGPDGTYVALGSAMQLDTRYASSGLFAAYTGNGRGSAARFHI